MHPQARRAARGLVCLGLGGLAAACVGDPLGAARLPKSSPIAADAERMVRANRKFPTFAQIPPAPKDVRPAASFKTAVTETETARDQLIAQTAPSTWTLTGTERFASQATAAARDEPAPSRDTEGFARSARERATPPPPPR